uniref:Uncharacterized protein n=1 Tax=Anopheles albimanus TaxID=7167 RepID=A0A182FF90_ANOAL
MPLRKYRIVPSSTASSTSGGAGSGLTPTLTPAPVSCITYEVTPFAAAAPPPAPPLAALSPVRSSTVPPPAVQPGCTGYEELLGSYQLAPSSSSKSANTKPTTTATAVPVPFELATTLTPTGSTAIHVPLGCQLTPYTIRPPPPPPPGDNGGPTLVADGTTGSSNLVTLATNALSVALPSSRAIGDDDGGDVGEKNGKSVKCSTGHPVVASSSGNSGVVVARNSPSSGSGNELLSVIEAIGAGLSFDCEEADTSVTSMNSALVPVHQQQQQQQQLQHQQPSPGFAQLQRTSSLSPIISNGVTTGTLRIFSIF